MDVVMVEIIDVVGSADLLFRFVVGVFELSGFFVMVPR
jgi:hypothetical protein